MTPILLTLPVALALGLAMGLDWYKSPTRRLKKAIAGLPRRPIAETPVDQDVRISGRAELLRGHQLEAPLTGRPCAAWRVTVRQIRGRSSRLLLDELASCDFALEDDSGRAIVRGSVSNLFGREARGTRPRKESSARRLEDFLEARGIEIEANRRRDLLWEEVVIEEGDLVTVAGCCTRELAAPTSGSSYRGDARQLVIGPLSDGPFPAIKNPRMAG